MGEAILTIRQVPIITPNPTVQVIGQNFTSLTVRLTNNHDKDVTIFYEENDTTPDANNIVVAADDFEDVVISNLNANQIYTIYAYAIQNGQRASAIVSGQGTTLKYTTAAPSILNVNANTDSVTFDLRNNDESTATVYYEVNDSTPDITVSVGAGQTVTRTISGLADDTSYTLYARAQASNENMSSTVSTGFSTEPDVTYIQGLNVEAWNVNSSISSPLNAGQFDNFFTAGSGKSLITNSQTYLSRPINWSDQGQSGAGGASSAKPSYLPADYYSWKAEGFIYAPTSGTYTFGVDGDDAVDVFVNGQNVANWYGAHGFRTSWTGGTSPTTQFSGTINLTGGQYYSFRARMEERAGGDGIHVGWRKPGDGSITLIPAASFFRVGAGGGESNIPANALFYFDPQNTSSYAGSGTTLTDLSGSGNNFSLNGVVFVDDAGIKSFEFNSSGDSINGSLDLRRTWSFEVWVKYLQTNPITFLGQGPTSTNAGLHIWQYSSSAIRFGLYSNDRDATGLSTTVNAWQQYVFTYNHSTFEKKIYRNGVRIDNTTVGGPNQYTGTGTLRIGQIYSTTTQNNDSRKRMAEMIMYSTALTDAEVSASFNLRRGRYGI